MTKHTVTVQANGMTYKVETDSDVFMIDGVEFKFSTPTVTVTSRATFRGSQTVTKKVACIKAVREASVPRRPLEDWSSCMGLREAKELVETGGTFEIFPESKGLFEMVCRENNLTPTYV